MRKVLMALIILLYPVGYTFAQPKSVHYSALGKYLVDEDGKLVMPSVDLTVEVKVPDDGHFVTCNFVIGFQQLKFEKPGNYSFDIAVDGRQEAGIPLLVKFFPPKAVD